MWLHPVGSDRWSCSEWTASWAHPTHAVTTPSPSTALGRAQTEPEVSQNNQHTVQLCTQQLGTVGRFSSKKLEGDTYVRTRILSTCIKQNTQPLKFGSVKSQPKCMIGELFLDNIAAQRWLARLPVYRELLTPITIDYHYIHRGKTQWVNCCVAKA